MLLDLMILHLLGIRSLQIHLLLTFLIKCPPFPLTYCEYILIHSLKDLFLDAQNLHRFRQRSKYSGSTSGSPELSAPEKKKSKIQTLY